MANSNVVDLMSIGAHCSEPSCRQVDFLPFTCDCCSRVFCLQHRQYSAHSCPAADKDLVVLACPLCAKGIKLVKGVDPYVSFEEHTRSDCDPSNYQRVHNKRRCPVPGCREKLTLSSTFTCKQCGLTVCLGHRHEADHACKGKAARGVAASLGDGMMAAFHSVLGRPANNVGTKPAVSASTRSPLPSNAAAALRPAPAVSRATAPRRAAAASNAPSDAGLERCPQCAATFSSVDQLILHVETAHAAAAPRGTAGGGNEACPHCGASFQDPLQLIRHVESHRFEAAQTTASTRKDGSGCVLS